MRRFLVALMAALSVQSVFAANAILEPTSRRANVKGMVEHAMIRSRNMLVDLRPLRDRNTTSAVFDFFPGARLDIVIERRDEYPSDRGLVTVLTGRIRNQPASTATFAILNNVMVGNVSTGKGRLYRLRYGGVGAVHTVIEADATKFPPERDSVQLKLPPQPIEPLAVTGTPVVVTNFASHSTRVVEVPWSNLPGVGHYCMVARWISASDPIPSSADTDSINLNTRASNNIIWRNLNIVEFFGMKAEAQFIVASPGGFAGATGTQSLLIRASRGEGTHSFLRHGRVLVTFDDALMSAWQAGGRQGNGYTAGAGSTFAVGRQGARFDAIALAPGTRGVVTLTFERTRMTPKRTYLIDAAQLMQAEGRFEAVLGGVSYEIRSP